ncbi:cAMP-dependent protein kinase catalytic subunit [Knufia obscura]|uniref:cAMP-dependent protein kinase catalytic subunit n=1 Tax=Knufia obscura TaxID=1635080 RepID=A0ABR0RMP3_9EURO|nr:cAMP-dependent protein kinase catalytic subunit [Knufia obscura]
MECMRDHFKQGQLLDGRFRALAPLNHGSFGMVFLAEDLLTKQEVAIKCLTKPSVASGDLPITADEGADELACHAILKFHPHLVNLVHHFETAAHTYLVLEYCSQGDLYEAIRSQRGPLETEHVRKFMLQLIGAVEHMHKNGLYHRDIKPENIFLASNGDMKLGDFGLATPSLWSDEACVGSDRYMAPEQYDHGGNGYSPAQADIWSIGICLLNVLFSRNPFVTPTESDVLFADYVRDRQSLFDIFPNMSNDTFEILSNALALDPNKRNLSALRSAVQQTLTFTVDDDDLDEFCTEERDVVRASANREPLRTPSIASPEVGDDSFPWSQVLHTTSPVKAAQHMPSIPDEYEEDMFSDRGHAYGESWFSGRNNTPSTMSSAFGASFKSMHIPAQKTKIRGSGPTAVPSSLPVQRTRPIPSMSQVFGKKDTVAKSWSDMWEEDEEEEREATLRARREINARGFSHESVKDDVPPVPALPMGLKRSSDLNARSQRTPRRVSPHVKVNENEPLLWQPKTPRRSSPKPADKWSELGNRRRNPTGPIEAPLTATKKRTLTQGSMTKKRSGSAAQEQSWHRRQSRNKSRPAHLDQDWRQQKVIDSSEDEDHEWVGGWRNFHL